jgi:lipopolysaccharide transport system ATP-binding protein
VLKPIVEIKHISKKYRIQAGNQPYLSLRENLFNFLRPAARKKEFWALDDVSFEVMPGDTLGVIGRNGAGKSTLLKILSRITPPTKGSITVRGRVASLLEVGTGFHPELSGRENIYLNGSILGMKRAEIGRQFDAILDFAGVGQFVDTPLKHYSSGMQLRLAFAVAAFLEPEVLVIDEVLAVGDSEFQKKCLGKMKEVNSQGRTILLVSHDLTAISTLTKKCIYLKEGKMQALSTTPQVIERYIREGQQKVFSFEKKALTDNTDPQITRVAIKSSLPNNVHEHGQPLEVDIDILCRKIPAHATWISCQVTDGHGKGLVHITNGGEEFRILSHEGLNEITVIFPQLQLYTGTYYLNVFFAGPPNAVVYERLREVLSFEVVMTGRIPEFGWQPDACVYMEQAEWKKRSQ